jgi:hypothetical protein
MAEADDAATGGYRSQIKADISACLSNMSCQPILFAGSGLSRRYFSAPSWDELLAALAKNCPLIDKDYAYYKQTLKSPLVVGKEFARLYQQWAWDKGKNQFPAEMFSDAVPEEAYIKYAISQHLAAMTPAELSAIADAALKVELAALPSIKPHAVITTNYDRFLELVFPEYQPVIGQQIIQGSQILFGEVFKIHGCVSDYNSLVFTQQDYDEFLRKKKYLSAKLLTYFSEHPLLFVGYSATDPNIQAILSDIDECLPKLGPPDSAIPNIYILEFRKEMLADYMPAREKLIAIEGGRSIRIKAIETDDFRWVFKAFGAHQPINGVSPKVLRALLHRSYDLVRHDIPRQTVHANFEMLERAVASGSDFAKLFGITTISKPSSNSANYPYVLTDLAEKIKGKGEYWYEAQIYLDRIKKEKGVDIKASDNRYHCATKTGRTATAIAHKYSDDLLDLMRRMKEGEAYELDL